MWNFNEKNLECVEGSVWVFLTAYINSEIWEENDKFKEKKKWKGTRTENFWKFSTIHIAKYEKLCSGKNPLQYSCLENPMDGGAW